MRPVLFECEQLDYTINDVPFVIYQHVYNSAILYWYVTYPSGDNEFAVVQRPPRESISYTINLRLPY